MPDTPNLTPPPEEPLSDATRAQMRQRLSDVTRTAQPRPGHRWLVPGLAAASVLAVVAGAFAVASTNDDGTGRGSSLQPAGPGTTQSPTSPPGESATPAPSGGSATPTPSDKPPPTATPTPGVVPSQSPNTATTAPSSKEPVTACADLIRDGWQPPLEEAPDISWDPGTGIARVTFTDDQLVLDIRNDPKCRELPTIGRMIGQILDNASTD